MVHIWFNKNKIFMSMKKDDVKVLIQFLKYLVAFLAGLFGEHSTNILSNLL